MARRDGFIALRAKTKTRITSYNVCYTKLLRLDRMMETVYQIYELWNRRVPTRPLNDWLREMTERHPPPMSYNFV